jgi:hypothetical protein
MEAEVTQALVLLLAHVLVVGVAGGVDPAPPPVRPDLVTGRLEDAVADVVVVADGVPGLLGLRVVPQPPPEGEQLG